MTDRWHDDVLVVIPSLNGGGLLARMLPTMEVPQSRVVVLDQGSTDDTASVCAGHGTGLVQLGRPHSHAQACNIGAGLARERGCRILCVTGNDVAFRPGVLAELAAEMARDPGLGVVAPAQVMPGDGPGHATLAYRATWALHDVRFGHDTAARDGAVRRLEADFCDLTCALVRLSAIDGIGFLDDAFEGHGADADLGFRLRKAGYGCASLPLSQVDRLAPPAEGAACSARDKALFIRKHLGFGFGTTLGRPGTQAERSLLNQGIQSIVQRYGLIDDVAPDLVLSHGLPEVDGYLYTTQEDPRAWNGWAERESRVRAILTPSVRVRDGLVDRGYLNSVHVPLGIEPDIFHPWVAAHRPAPGATAYLAVVHGQQLRLLRGILGCWHRFASRHADVRLVLYGPGLGGCVGRAADRAYRADNAEVSQYDAERIEVRDVLWPRTAAELARLYASFHYTIAGSGGEDAALAILQSTACGVPCLVAGPGAADHPVRDAVLTGRLLDLRPQEAAQGPEPDGRALLALLEATHRCGGLDRAALASDGVDLVRGRFSLRNTAMGLHHALSHLQIRRPSRVLGRLERASRPAALPDTGVAVRPVQRGAGVARITERFGSTWSEVGLPRASRMLARELGYFVTGRASRAVRKGLSRAAGPAGAAEQAAPVAGSTLLIGRADPRLGLDEPLRSLAVALSTTSLAFGIHPVGIGAGEPDQVRDMQERYDLTRAHAINVIAAAPEDWPAVFDAIPPGHFDRSHTILGIGWDPGEDASAWETPLGRIDELWVPTASVADSLRTVFDRTITVVPPCVEPELVTADGRRWAGLDAGVFYFTLSPGDGDPLGVVRAFRTAFAGSEADVGLLIEAASAPGHGPPSEGALRLAALDDDRIRLIEPAATRRERLSLVAAIGCHVSLHRCTATVEATLLGKPVIVAGRSGGNAASDEAACAAAMLRVFDGRGEPEDDVAAARRYVAGRCSPDAVGRVIERRLGEIARLRTAV